MLARVSDIEAPLLTPVSCVAQRSRADSREAAHDVVSDVTGLNLSADREVCGIYEGTVAVTVIQAR